MGKPAKLKLWIVNHYALPPNEAGSSRHYELAKELTKRNYDVYIFTSNIHYNNYKTLKVFKRSQTWLIEEFEPNLYFVWLKTHKYHKNNIHRYINILSFTWRLKLNSKAKIFGKPDIIIGSSFHLFSPWLSMKFAKKHNIPFISEIRDLWPETLIQLGFSKWNPLVILLDKMQKEIYKSSDHIILLFPYAHEYINQLKLGVLKSKMTWIPNGVNVLKFANAKKHEPNDYTRNGRFSVLNAGSLGNVYALEFLIEAADILNTQKAKIDIHFLGDGPKKQELLNLSKKLKLDNVFFHEPVNKEEIPAIIQEFDLLYASLMDSPLYKWGMSLNKIHEYLASGKPILFAVNAINNPVKEAGAGRTVPSNNSLLIAQEILNFSKMPEDERIIIGENGSIYAKNNFDFSILVKKLNSILEEAIKNNKKQTS